MQVRVTKWGNSLGIRVPKSIAARIGLTEGSQVRIFAEDDRIVISTDRPVYQLEALLEGMTPEAMHDAFDWGPDVGREVVD